MGVRMMTLPGPKLYTDGPAVYLVSGREEKKKRSGVCASGKTPCSPLLSHSRIIYFHTKANHRSWTDFYLDVVATGGRAQMLSRLAVAVAFPLMMPAVMAVRAVVLFNRGKGAASDHAAFNASVRAKMGRSPMVGLIVYPEGNTGGRERERERERNMQSERAGTVGMVFLSSPPLSTSSTQATAPPGRTPCPSSTACCASPTRRGCPSRPSCPRARRA